MAKALTTEMFCENTIRTLDNIVSVAEGCKEQLMDARGRTPAEALGRRATDAEVDAMVRLDYVLGFLYRESKDLGIEYEGGEE